MGLRTTKAAGLLTATLLTTLALAAAHVSAQQNANTSKAGSRSASTPTATRQANSNRAARESAPSTGKVAPQTPPKATAKEDPGKMTYNRVPHQYVIESSDTGHYHLVLVGVRNAGKGPSKAGQVYATVVYLEEGVDPRKSKVLGAPKYVLPAKGGLKVGVWAATADLPALQPGESAQVQLHFGGQPMPAEFSYPAGMWRMGVSIHAYNGEKMADGQDSASLNDFLSGTFFNK